MWRYRQTSRSNETGKVFKGNQPLSDDLSGMQPSRGCSPSGRGRRGGWRPYGKGAVCLHWDLTAARRGARVYVQVNVQLVYVCVCGSGTIPLTSSCGVRGSCPLLPFLLQSEWGGGVNRGSRGGGWGCIKFDTAVIGWVSKESGGVKDGLDEEVWVWF